jgi:hypothetical protein
LILHNKIIFFVDRHVLCIYIADFEVAVKCGEENVVGYLNMLFRQDAYIFNQTYGATCPKVDNKLQLEMGTMDSFGAYNIACKIRKFIIINIAVEIKSYLKRTASTTFSSYITCWLTMVNAKSKATMTTLEGILNIITLLGITSDNLL